MGKLVNVRRTTTWGALTILVVAGLAVVGARPVDAAPGGPLTYRGGQTMDQFRASGGSASASNGSKTLVVWNRRDGGIYHVWGAITAADGTSKGPAFRISYRTQDEFSADVAWNGSVFLVVWTHDFNGNDSDFDIRGRRVSAAGALLGSELTFASSTIDEDMPSVASGPGGIFQVVWRDERALATTGANIWARQMNGAGTSFGAEVQVSGDNPNTYDSFPDIAWVANDQLFVVASVNNTFVKTNFLNSAGQLTGGVYVAARNRNSTAPAIASDGDRVLVVYREYIPGPTLQDPGSYNVVRTFVDPAVFGVSDTVTISTGSQFQHDVAVVYNGMFLAAWTRWHDASQFQNIVVYGARIKRDGAVLDPGGFLVSDDNYIDATPSVNPGTSAANTFGLQWSYSDGGKGGVINYGVTAAAPK